MVEKEFMGIPKGSFFYMIGYNYGGNGVYVKKKTPFFTQLKLILLKKVHF